MSFGEYNSRSSGSNQTEYQHLCSSISNNVQHINNNVIKIQRLVEKVGTSDDVSRNLENLEKETQRLAKETNSNLKQLHHVDGDSPTERRQRKLQIERLTDNFSTALNNYQKAQRVAAEKEKQYVSRARAASGIGLNPFGGETTLIDFERSGCAVSSEAFQMQTEDELSLEVIEDRERNIRQLEADIVGVNEIFRDLANMVHEQGEVIDSIEANVENAAVHVETANVQLEKARDYQKASRKKLCCILVIVAVAAGALGLIIWLSLPNSN